MVENNLVDGLPCKLESDYLKCGVCIKNKMHNLPLKKIRTKANEILEIVHSDLSGPHSVEGFAGSKYFFSLIDDYSKFAVFYTIKSKFEVCDCLKEYINKFENLTSNEMKKFRCDNRREYLNNRIFKLASKKGILIDPCPPYVHELNGVAEKFNRTIMSSARCLIDEPKLSLRYWLEVVKTATFLKNRILTKSAVEIKRPFEIFFQKRPNLSDLKLFGSKVFVRAPEEKRKSK